MSSAVVQLLVLAGIAIFLILKLKNVLGTRDGFEKPPVQGNGPVGRLESSRADLKVVEGGVDRDIMDHVKPGSDAAKALAKMKAAEPEFSLTEFLTGAKGAYEMILMAFENGNLEQVRPFLSSEVDDALSQAIVDRQNQGISIEAKFVGVSEISVANAEFDDATGEGEITIRFTAELTSVVRDKDGEIIDGNPNEIKRQRDVWSFSRKMGAANPNWYLVATDE